MKLHRFQGNPILSPHPDHPWEDLAVFNPAAYYDEEKQEVLLLYRTAESNPDYKCWFGLARSTDGYHFQRVSDQPVLSPSIEGYDGATIQDPRIRLEAKNYLAKAKQYGMPDADILKGFGAQGWSVGMTIWEQSNIVVNSGKELTPENFKAQLAGTNNNHIYTSVPFGCSQAPPPYIAVCSTRVSLTQWDGNGLVTKIDNFSGVDLVAGTTLKTGP